MPERISTTVMASMSMAEATSMVAVQCKSVIMFEDADQHWDLRHEWTCTRALTRANRSESASARVARGRKQGISGLVKLQTCVALRQSYL